MNGTALNAGTTPVRDGYRFDEARLAQWMAVNVEGFVGPLAVTQFKGGQSNPTYKLATPGHAYVLRRKPLGGAPGAHAVDREARVMKALGGAGYPVPRVYGLCTDETVIGSWFYVMDCVEGRVFWSARFESVPAGGRRAYFSAMNETLASLHRLDPAALGLADYGKTGNYFQRQISRWSRQYHEDEIAGRDANMERLIGWLAEAIPQNDETGIAHTRRARLGAFDPWAAAGRFHQSSDDVPSAAERAFGA
jgi:aminoglycoside phosphotransferase (APT) family kinase protein